MRDRGAAEGDHLIFVEAHAFPPADPHAELLAVARIGQAEGLDVGDGGMRVEKLLDLAGINVLAAADDHVLQPPDDVAVALRVDGREIAGMHEPGLVDGSGGCAGVVPVAAHDAIAASQ